jgi:membrane protein implicated in regulation of membrane protease activity
VVSRGSASCINFDKPPLMPTLELPGDPKFTFGVAIGLALIVLARWASRTRGTKLDSWVALRVGDVLFTEIAGAFLLGYGLGGLLAPPDTTVTGGPPGPGGRIGFGGRFGGFGGLGANLPLTLGAVGAVVAVLTRLDLSGLLLRGARPRNGLSQYIGWEGRVIEPIPAGGFGQIAMRDGMGYPLSAVATAEIDLPEGTPVRVMGTKGLNLVVAPSSSA